MVINLPCLTNISDWLVQNQTVSGKDFSNPLIVDNLLKIVVNSPYNFMFEELASPKANGYG